MDFTKMTVEELERRKAEIAEEINGDNADLDALESEARSIKEELERRKAEAAKDAETRRKVAEGDGEKRKDFRQEEKKEMNYGIETKEYRDAWVKKLIGREMSAEERTALTSASAVIPTMTVNAVWDKLVKPAELLSRVDVSRFPTYVRFPVATTVNSATSQAVGTSITESSDVVSYVDLIPNEYVKLLTVGADIEHMAIDAIHDWIVDNITGKIREAINSDILIGNGTNKMKGIATSVTANATAIPAAANLAAGDILKIMGTLGGNYQNGAIWIMTPSMFYTEIMALPEMTDYVINEGFAFKLFGHDVILMSEALISSKENIFYGDPKAYKANIFKALEIKPFETAASTNIQFRGATMADGELIDTSAFVRFARA